MTLSLATCLPIVMHVCIKSDFSEKILWNLESNEVLLSLGIRDGIKVNVMLDNKAQPRPNILSIVSNCLKDRFDESQITMIALHFQKVVMLWVKVIEIFGDQEFRSTSPKKFRSYYTLGGWGPPTLKHFRKFFLKMKPLGVKTCGESEFDIYEAKKCFSDSRKACVLKRKVAKMRFFDFSLQYSGLTWIREVFFLFENVKFRFPACFYPWRSHFQKKFSRYPNFLPLI
jgi:hypothetical protein